MQPKVSIVIPCYNKVRYISRMFDSIIAQKWDNIELVLVNDGSTDGTREVIAGYESRFHARGFKVAIIDQENRGLPAAVCEGLKRVTGEFVCQIDADDELDPEYVSTMAGWLAENPEYDWAACDLVDVRKNTSYHQMFPNSENADCSAEKWILRRTRRIVVVYMIRVSYMYDCNVIGTFFTAREGAQEAQIFLPLALGGGKIKYFQMPLYKYMYDNPEDHISHAADYNAAVTIVSGFFHTICEMIARIACDEHKKRRMQVMAEYKKLSSIISHAISAMLSPHETWTTLEHLLEMLKTCFYPEPIIDAELVKGYFHSFCTAVEDNFLGVQPKPVSPPTGRIVAWGAMGMNARSILPTLKNTALEPTELWDLAGDGVSVQKPNLHSLTANDFILILPSSALEIRLEAAAAGCENIMLSIDIMRYVATL